MVGSSAANTVRRTRDNTNRNRLDFITWDYLLIKNRFKISFLKTSFFMLNKLKEGQKSSGGV